VALVLWLFQIQGRLQEQNESIRSLAYSVEQLDTNQRLATDTLLGKIADAKPEEFLARYSKAVKDRDEAVRRAEDWRASSEVLGARARELDEKLQVAQKDLARSKEDAKDAPKLRDRVAQLEEINDRKQRQLDDIEPFLKKSKEGGIDVDQLMQERNRTRYIAYAGWSVSALLAAGLAATFFLYRPTLQDEAAPPEPQDGERPTHRIV
jgi:hypothetical protein